MKEISLKELRKEIEKSQDEKRFEHTLGVTYTAAVLAMCHDENVEKAKIAGLCMIVPSVSVMKRR